MYRKKPAHQNESRLRFYCLIRLPWMISSLPGITVIEAPEPTVNGTFKIQVPSTGSILTSLPDGSGDGGTTPPAQLAGTFQLPLPVNV